MSISKDTIMEKDIKIDNDGTTFSGDTPSQDVGGITPQEPKEVKKVEEVKEVKEVKKITLKVDSACSHCGKKGFKTILEFCSEECKQAFIIANK